jgi:hypothetical protein
VLRAPLIFQKFDWVIWDTFEDYNIKEDQVPRTVLIRPDFFHRRFVGHSRAARVFSKIPLLSESSETTKRSLVISGDDDHLSQFANAAQIQYLKDRFSDIYISSKNQFSTTFKTIPLGFTNPYLIIAGYRVVQQAYLLAKTIPPMRKIESADADKLALIAWGSKHPGLDRRIFARQSLRRFVADSNGAFQRTQTSMKDYWIRLPSFKYYFCATGNGIQSPKIFEALLTRVIPITLREPAFEDLVSYGFPLLIVDSWYNITRPLLEKLYIDKYSKTNWTRVEYLMTNDAVFHFIKYGKYDDN